MGRRLFIPHHVTGFWVPVYTDNPITTGSLGAGVLVGGAVASYEPGGVWYNDTPLEGGLGVRISSQFPLGYGYAASAVVSIAKAVGELGLSREAFAKAHVEEVTRRTGLGDVLAIYTGGCLVVRVRPGAPGVGEAYSLPCPAVYVVTLDLARVDTGVVLQTRHEAIVKAGREAYKAFMKNPSFQTFLHLAAEFSRRVGFLDERLEALERHRGVLGLFVKKGVAAVFVEREWALDVARIAERLGRVHLVLLRELHVAWI
ncbi:GHMP kinase [Pyrobaculum sp.]|uniref:GHMP kinase n=1 Tax=Pyrobaculum sp. TaxID=2004705 RepID=UPI003D0EB0B6